MKSHEHRDRLIATDSDPRPGDFPLGSVESRAAARGKLMRVQWMTPYDRDCLVIRGMVPLLYSYSPNSRDIHETEVGKRGWEISQALHPIIPYHLDPFQQQQFRFSRCRETFMDFHILRRRLPISGDILQWQEIESRWGVQAMAHRVAEFCAAWERGLPQLPCPVKFEQDRVWCRSAESTRSKEIWEQDCIPQTAPEIWPIIEAEALGKESTFKLNGTTLDAVVFREDEDGSYYTEQLK